MLVFNERTGEFEERPGPNVKPSTPSFNPSSYNDSPYAHHPKRGVVRVMFYEILSDILFVEEDEIDEDSDIQFELGADSIDKVDIIERVEETFDIIILDEEADTVDTVGEAIDLILENIDMNDEIDADLADDDDDDDDDWEEDEEDDEDDEDWDDDDDDWEEDEDDEEDDDDDWDDDEDDEDDDWDDDEEEEDDEDEEDEDWDDVSSTYYDERNQIRDQVIAIVADKLALEEDVVDEDSYFFSDLGADSLDMVELIMELEKVYGISITEDDVDDIETVGDAINFIYYNT